VTNRVKQIFKIDSDNPVGVINFKLIQYLNLIREPTKYLDAMDHGVDHDGPDGRDGHGFHVRRCLP
jgi:hypothetical protein